MVSYTNRRAAVVTKGSVAVIIRDSVAVSKESLSLKSSRMVKRPAMKLQGPSHKRRTTVDVPNQVVGMTVKKGSVFPSKTRVILAMFKGARLMRLRKGDLRRMRRMMTAITHRADASTNEAPEHILTRETAADIRERREVTPKTDTVLVHRAPRSVRRRGVVRVGGEKWKLAEWKGAMMEELVVTEWGSMMDQLMMAQCGGVIMEKVMMAELRAMMTD